MPAFRSAILVLVCLAPTAQAWAPSLSAASRLPTQTNPSWSSARRISSSSKNNKDYNNRRLTIVYSDSDSNKEDPGEQRTSFDQAGQALTKQEDQERMDEMGDFDLNPNSQQDSMEAMRAAIRARTSEMGLEKSKVSADYIAAKSTQAQGAGPPGAQQDPDSFGGLDLSRISDQAPPGSKSSYDESLPSIFYDPEDDLTQDEQDEVDPVRKENPFGQGLNELSNAKWPGPAAALREVVVLVIVVAVTAALIISWDQLLRSVYTTAGFIPSKEDLANYANRFDGLDLPTGWTNNMSEDDVAVIADQVNTVLPPAAAAAAGSSLPQL